MVAQRYSEWFSRQHSSPGRQNVCLAVVTAVELWLYSAIISIILKWNWCDNMSAKLQNVWQNRNCAMQDVWGKTAVGFKQGLLETLPVSFDLKLRWSRYFFITLNIQMKTIEPAIVHILVLFPPCCSMFCQIISLCQGKKSRHLNESY